MIATLGNGIVIEGNSARSVIANNITEGMDAGIWLTGTGVTGTLATGNVNRFVHTAAWLDWGSPGANMFATNF